MNNASKGRCVTVTPRGISKEDFRLAILDRIAIGKMQGRTWIRTKKNPESFRRCVTITPQGTEDLRFRFANFAAGAISKVYSGNGQDAGLSNRRS